jgi:hypothetical protein
MENVAPVIVVWLSLLFLGSIFFRRRGPGGNPGFAAALQLIVPGMGYTYLHRWDHLLAAYVVLLAGLWLMSGPLHLANYLTLFGILVYAGSVIDCIVTGYLVNRRENK